MAPFSNKEVGGRFAAIGAGRGADSTVGLRFLVPLDQPTLVDEPDLDQAAAIQRAFKRRPDYLMAELSLDSARRNLAFTENQMLPSVNFTATLSQWLQVPLFLLLLTFRHAKTTSSESATP